MSVLSKEIRSWWIEKPLGHNFPTDVVFEDFKPTVTNAPDREWVRVISLDDFHSSTNINITRYVDLCQELVKSRKQNEIMREALKVAANQLEGISLGIQTHGRNINVRFFIETSLQNANSARQALKQIKEIEG